MLINRKGPYLLISNQSDNKDNKCNILNKEHNSITAELSGNVLNLFDLSNLLSP